MDRTQHYHAKAPLNDPDTIHFVLCDYGRHGQAWMEMNFGMTEARLVQDLVEGQIDNHIVQILAVNTKMGIVRDVTGQMGAFVFYHYDAIDDGLGEIPRHSAHLCLRAGFDVEPSRYASERAVFAAAQDKFTTPLAAE